MLLSGMGGRGAARRDRRPCGLAAPRRGYSIRGAAADPLAVAAARLRI